MRMRRIWTGTSAVCWMSMATIVFAGILAPQAPSAPSNPSSEEQPVKLGRSGNIQNRLEDLSQQLNLTDQQKAKIRPLLKHEARRFREVQSNPNLTEAQVRRRMAMVRRNTDQHIAEILTPDQKQKWQDMRPERRGGSPEGGQGGPSGQGAPAGLQNPPSPN